MRQSPTALKWPYPLSRPSLRFQTTNTLVRQLDVRFSALSYVRQRDWALFAARFPWAAVCWPFWFFAPPPDQSHITALEAYRAVNAAGYSAGAAVVDVPPAVPVLPGGDVVTKDGSSPLFLRWFRFDGGVSGDFLCQICTCGLTHAPESGPAPQKYSWSGVRAVSYNTAFSVADLFEPSRGVLGFGALSLLVGIMSPGLPPFLAARVVYERSGSVWT